MIPVDCGMIAAGYLLFSINVFMFAAAMLLASPILAACSRKMKVLALLGLNAIAGAITFHVAGPSWQLLAPIFTGILLTFSTTCLLKGFSFPGNLLMTALTQFYLACMLWGLSIVALSGVSTLTRSLMIAGFLLLSPYIIIALIQRLEEMEAIYRRDLRAASELTPALRRNRYPKVSLHVPTYSEPPEMVMATLNKLAELEYQEYEVLVIDNNTSDPSLWRPIQIHCERLGERFRFFHVDRLSGAKAGALNFALRHTSSDAELIGVVDSDYQARSDYLASLAGYFDDPKMGFVQTPHAYRDWEQCTYWRICNWEYSLYLVSTLVSRNERMAAINLGTMGLIRRSVLEEVGGWCEWCLTEDSELALRIHAHGYRSTYINTVLGRGLIPETFHDYKQQRFRWRYGSIQELRRHSRLLLPKPLARTSSLTASQKLTHLMHGLDTLKAVLEFLLLFVGASLAALMLVQRDAIHFPAYVWWSFGLAAVLLVVLKWQVFRILKWSFNNTLGAIVAHAALDHTYAMAGFSALLTSNTLWRKTNKFRGVPTGLAALGAAMPELFLGSITFATSILLLCVANANDLLVLLAIGGLLKGSKYLSAALLVILSERGIRQRSCCRLSVPST